MFLGLRLRWYRRKTKNRLPPKQLPPCCITAKKIPPNFSFTAYRRTNTAKKRKTVYRQKITAVLHHRRKNTTTLVITACRQSRYRQKTKYRLAPKKYRRIAVPPRLSPTEKPFRPKPLICFALLSYRRQLRLVRNHSAMVMSPLRDVKTVEVAPNR